MRLQAGVRRGLAVRAMRLRRERVAEGIAAVAVAAAEEIVVEAVAAATAGDEETATVATAEVETGDLDSMRRVVVELETTLEKERVERVGERAHAQAAAATAAQERASLVAQLRKWQESGGAIAAASRIAAAIVEDAVAAGVAFTPSASPRRVAAARCPT